MMTKMLKSFSSFSSTLICLVGIFAVPGVHASPLAGTYLQLTYGHGQWEPEKWSELFAIFNKLDLSELIIQWTVYEETAFYPCSEYRSVANPPLETILDLAGQGDMEVLVGLAHDPAFWHKIERESRLVEVYLKHFRKKSIETARHLFPIVSKYPAFKGWYLCEEIDDRNWLERSARTILEHHLLEEVRQLREISPGSLIGISGFSNGFADPAVFRGFWRQILESASLDLVLFQDGFGTAKQDTVSLPLYLEALQEAAASLETETRIIIELFEQKSRGDQPFSAEPAPLVRILQQLEIANDHSLRAPIAFSIPEYMSPLAGPEGHQLYQDFIRQFSLNGGIDGR